MLETLLAALTTDRPKYYLLMALVCDKIPTSAIDTLLREKNHPATASELTAVRNGRKNSLAWLIDLVEVGLPNFPIPDELRPAPATAAAPAPALLFQ